MLPPIENNDREVSEQSSKKVAMIAFGFDNLEIIK